MGVDPPRFYSLERPQIPATVVGHRHRLTRVIERHRVPQLGQRDRGMTIGIGRRERADHRRVLQQLHLARFERDNDRFEPFARHHLRRNRESRTGRDSSQPGEEHNRPAHPRRSLPTTFHTIVRPSSTGTRYTSMFMYSLRKMPLAVW